MRTKYSEKLLCFLILLLTFVSGCGDDDDYRFYPVGLPANIQVNHVSARAVPASIDTLRFTGADVAGEVTYGPETRDYQEQIFLPDVPLNTRGFLIEYLSHGTVVGRFVTTVALQPGETYIIDNPAWVDVGDFTGATQLNYLVQPTDGRAGEALDPPVRVVVLDVNRRLVESSSLSVTLTLNGEGTMSGTTTVEAVDGIATFDDLTFTAGSGYTLTASGEGVASVTSAGFDIAGAQPNDVTPRSLALPGEYFSGSAGINGSTVSADFNGDGRQDIALLESISTGGEGGDKALMVFLQLENGDYTRNLIVDGHTGTSQLFTGDFNGDGNADLLFVSQETNLQLLAGNGQGGFEVLPTVATGGEGSGTNIQVGDFNNDNIVDVAVTPGTEIVIPRPALLQIVQENFLVHLGSADGLGAGVSSNVPTENFFAFGNIVGSDALDYVVVSQGELLVFEGQGDGTFADEPAMSFPLEETVYSIALGDFDGQRGLDIALLIDSPERSPLPAISNPPSPAVALQVLLQDGEGGLIEADGSPYDHSVYINIAVASPSRYLASGDLNGDGIADLGYLSVNGEPNDIRVFRVTTTLSGDGGEGSLFGEPRHSFTPLFASELSLSDVNADGKTDALVSGSSSAAYLLSGEGNGTFLPGEDRGSLALAAANGDVNGDGRDDLVVVDLDSIHLFLRDASGSLPALPTTIVVGGGESEVVLGNQIHLADVDGDGDLDLVTGGPNEPLFNSGSSRNDLMLFYNQNGSYSVDDSESISFPSPYRRFAVLDLNEDETLDFVANTNGTGLQFLVSVLEGYESESYDNETLVGVLCVIQADGAGPSEIAIGSDNGNVAIVSYAGESTSEVPVDTPSNTGVSTVAAGDLNGDGAEDLLFALRRATDQGHGRAYVALNSGGDFPSVTTILVPRVQEYLELLVGDVDGDGLADIVGSESEFGAYAVLRGDGSGTSFESENMLRFVGAPGGPTALVISDLDGDGENEVLVATYNASGYLMTILCLLLLYGLREGMVRARRARGTV